MTGIERFAEIMDTPVTIADAPDAKPLVVKDGGIDFDDVSFEYPDDHNKVLRHVDLHIRPGENVALVGPSGGGKTTLCNLIPRFYDVTGGKILIDGQDVRGVTLHSLRGAIGVVQQDVTCSAARWRRTSPMAAPARPAPKLRRLPAWPEPMPLSAL